MKNQINLEYPRTSYNALNTNVEKYLNNNMNNFMKSIDEIAQNTTYTLKVNFDGYELSNCVSYVFYNSTYLGGAHPNSTIYTLNYDKENKKIIDIDDLVNTYPDILNYFSKKCRENLSKRSCFKDKYLKEMMMNGTQPTANNFKNFVFTDEGIMILFERYQIAPYSAGEFSVLIN